MHLDCVLHQVSENAITRAPTSTIRVADLVALLHSKRALNTTLYTRQVRSLHADRRAPAMDGLSPCMLMASLIAC